ncbi:MAG: GH3 auxin-responsive promoter family protein [Bacteroidota bacterium]
MALSRPVVHAMEKGTFYQWLRMKKKLGGQHKVPRLSNNRHLVEEILKMEVTA